MRDHTNVEDEAYKDPEYYFTDAISDDAVKSIKRHFSEPINKPLFQYVAYTAPHWPLHAREKDIAKYRGRFRNGWDRLREERLERMIGMGLIEPKWALSPSNSSRPDRNVVMPAWEDVSHKEWQQRRMEVYAAQIDVMDQGIGRIVLALEEHGQLDNTLIIFLADNGGEAGELSTGMADEKWATELGIFNQTTKAGESVRFGNTPDVWPGDQNTYASYGASWANLSNTPFRLYKGWIHEGGIATPFITHWPNRIKASPGAVNHSPWQLPDVMATLLDIAGAPYPTEFEGRDVLPLEGRSFASVIDGRDVERSAPLFWEHEGNAAVRDGRWKLVRNYWHARSMSMDDPLAWELY